MRRPAGSPGAARRAPTARTAPAPPFTRRDDGHLSGARRGGTVRRGPSPHLAVGN